MVTVHDILAGAVLAGIAGVAVFQNLAESDGGGQGLLLRVLSGEPSERDGAPPPPPGVGAGPVSTVVRTFTPTATPTSGGGGTTTFGGGSLPDRSGEILVPRSLDPRDRSPTGTGSGAQLTT